MTLQHRPHRRTPTPIHRGSYFDHAQEFPESEAPRLNPRTEWVAIASFVAGVVFATAIYLAVGVAGR